MLEVNKLYLGDCLEVMKDIEDKSIDLVITDPPYGINYSSYSTNSKKIINDDNLDWVTDFANTLSSKVKEDSHLYCFVDFEYMPEFVFEFRKYWKIRNLLKIPRCIKGNGGDRIFQQQDEYAIFATKGKGRKFNETKILKPSEGYKKDKRRKGNKEFLYRLPDRWDWTKASAFNHNRLHPTQKEVSCLQDMIILSSNENDLIVDPFIGSATTAIACLNTNRNYIGIEKDENYYNVACNRIKNYVKEA